ncbi:hypothetical protein [Alteraurantiacibacter palmitatis]|uniref:Uncharacterized protein n=1 Tax=Alteraurantiacibacter palmitatis TaxID=2054628 RepID=A0ABV7E965_9SPHN
MPAAAADNFARAILTDMPVSLCVSLQPHPPQMQPDGSSKIAKETVLPAIGNGKATVNHAQERVFAA